MVDIYKAAGDIRLWKAFIGHCVVIYPKNFININLIFKYFFFCSGFFLKVSQIELSVVKVNDRKLCSKRVLLNLLKLDVRIGSTADLFFEGHFIITF